MADEDTGKPPEAKAQKAVGIGCVGLIGLVVVMCGAGALFGEDPPDEGSTSMAEIICEDFVKDRLKAPSTADFADTTSTDLGAERYRVSGAVDAENSFGAKIRDTYVCEVTYKGEDRWHLEALTGLGD